MTEIRVRVRRPDPPVATPEDIFEHVLRVPVGEQLVMGIDPSLTSTGLALLYQGRLRASTLTPSKRKGSECRGTARLAWYRDELRTIIRRYTPALIVIEGYAFGAKFSREALGELGGVIRLLCRDEGVPYVVFQPTQLKMFATGKGGGAKDNVSKELFKWYGVDLTDNNQVDATGLAIMGLATLDPAMARTDFQRKALRETPSE